MYNLIRAWEIEKEYRTGKVPIILSRITLVLHWGWYIRREIRRHGIWFLITFNIKQRLIRRKQ